MTTAADRGKDNQAMANIAKREPRRNLGLGLDRFFSDPFFRSPLRAWGDWPAWSATDASAILPVDIAESDEELTVTASLPGYAREEIQVQVDDGVLTIAAEHSEDTDSGDQTNGDATGEPMYIRRERRYGTVRRSFTLPHELRDSELKAELKNGVLRIHIPKAEAPAPTVVDVEVHED